MEGEGAGHEYTEYTQHVPMLGGWKGEIGEYKFYPITFINRGLLK